MTQSSLERNPALRTPALYDTPPPPVSLLTGFDCLDFQDLAGGGGGRPTTVVPSHFQIRSYGPESGGLMLLKRGF